MPAILGVMVVNDVCVYVESISIRKAEHEKHKPQLLVLQHNVFVLEVLPILSLLQK